MDRRIVSPQIDEYGYVAEGTGGWFDAEKATCYDEDKRWNGNNMIGMASGGQCGYEDLYRTAGGRWVHHRDFRNEYNGSDVYRYITADEAKEWMVRAGVSEEELAQAFPDVEEERGPGQPQIGTVRKITLPDDAWAALGELADAEEVSRSELVRRAVAAYLA